MNADLSLQSAFIRFICPIRGEAFPILSLCTPFPLCSLWFVS